LIGLSDNKDTIERLDAANKKLDLIIVILLVNSGMKLPDIAKTLGVSVRTIQNWLPVAKLKYAKGRRAQPALEEVPESPPQETEPQNSASQAQA
jgi:DNA-directed RNA polymerase specialized sigma24 family protein